MKPTMPSFRRMREGTLALMLTSMTEVVEGGEGRTTPRITAASIPT